ncbi:MAG: cation:proton antiporter [Tepidisphaeraceae bacterium]
MHGEFPLITLIAAAFTAAWVFGLITQKLGLSPIVGYLLGGIAIGPHTPGFVGDPKLASELAELGVILLMFGVGLHFHLGDLLSVRKVAVPGALGQSAVATVLGVAVALAFGMPWKSGLVLGMAMAVASTVVLIRVLTDFKKLDTPAGTVAVGWLIVEDLLTVVVLVLIPALGDHGGSRPIYVELPIAIGKLGVLVALMLLAGSRLFPWVMVNVARLRSRELFTLTVLVMAIAVATASAYAFGASMALGAFLAGMVVGQSKVSHQAAADALPLRDAFAVLFFASVGMLFDPFFVLQQPLLLLAGLAIVLIAKPLTALAIVAILGRPVSTALAVAIGLAQIGEFSFILSDLGRKSGLLGERGHNLLVACAIVSITLNPILFRIQPKIEALLRKWPALWAYLNRSVRNEGQPNEPAEALLKQDEDGKPLAVILGYGPVGRAVDQMLREKEVETVIVEMNMDTVEQLEREGRAAIFGDAYNIEVMSQAVARASHLVITLPHAANRDPLIAAAKLINPHVKVFVRARYIREGEELARVGADAARYEEAEVAVALARLVLADQGAEEDVIRRRTNRLRDQMREAARVF